MARGKRGSRNNSSDFEPEKHVKNSDNSACEDSSGEDDVSGVRADTGQSEGLARELESRDAESQQATFDHSQRERGLNSVEVGSTSNDLSSARDAHPVVDTNDGDTGRMKSMKGMKGKERRQGKRRGRHESPEDKQEAVLCGDSSQEEDAAAVEDRCDADTAPSKGAKGAKGKERKQGRNQRGRRKADDDDEPREHINHPNDDQSCAATQHGSRRRRRGARRDHDSESASDRERVEQPRDENKKNKRISEIHGNSAKQNVDKLGREANSTTFVSFKTFHGKHLAALPSGELRGKSSVIGEAEKFELARHPDDTISLKTCHGTYIAVDRNGNLNAGRTVVGDKEKFELLQHAAGAVDKHTFIGAGYMCASLKSCHGLFVAADPKGGVKANRRMVSGWESFHLKARVQAAHLKPAEHIEPANAVIDIPIFDACCDLEAIFKAEENYAKSHNDHVAVTFSKRARARRAQGLEYSFSNFREEHKYPASFSGCVAVWDATNVLPVENGNLDEELGVRGRSDSDFESRHAWAAILAERSAESEQPCVHAAFGIPAASAAEADDAVMERLRQLAKQPQCVAIGPVGVDLSDPPIDGKLKEEHRCLNASQVLAEFGALPSRFWESPKAVYDAKRDPMCVRMVAAGMAQESWIAEHGDRRLSQFEGACRDYAQRRLDAQFRVAEEQVRLALELRRTLIVQLPPQDEAERRMAEILVASLGQGSSHPVLLSCFRGRPKCAAALLKHLPGLMIGFSGLLTHTKLRDCLGEVAFDTPLDRAVLESLGPRYPPAVPGIGDVRGSFSHPAHVPLVGEELAKVKGVEVSTVLRAAWSNATRLFGIETKSADCQDYADAACGEEVAADVNTASDMTPGV